MDKFFQLAGSTTLFYFFVFALVAFVVVGIFSLATGIRQYVWKTFTTHSIAFLCGALAVIYSLR